MNIYMYYKVKLIDKTGVYKTIIVCDSNTQEKLESDPASINEDSYIFNNNTIHLDDTIENIKYKITKIIQLDLSLDEIYIYAYKNKKYSSKEIFNILSQNNNFTISKARFFNFLSNINEIDLDSLPIQTEYNHDDVLKLKINDKENNRNVCQ